MIMIETNPVLILLYAILGYIFIRGTLEIVIWSLHRRRAKKNVCSNCGTHVHGVFDHVDREGFYTCHKTKKTVCEVSCDCPEREDYDIHSDCEACKEEDRKDAD